MLNPSKTETYLFYFLLLLSLMIFSFTFLIKHFKKADEKTSIAKAPSSYHSSQIDSTSQSEKHGTTEETTFTETRCVTETTMRMEHKSPHPDIQAPSPIPHKERVPHTVNSDITNDYTHLRTEIKPTVSVNLPVTSITQPQNKIDSFINKAISSNTNEINKYTTFENTQRPDQLMQGDLNTAQRSNASFKRIPSPLPKHDVSLTPGLPPEIGYMPKVSDVNRNSISDRIKMLESSYDETHEAPQGGIKVFPPGNHFESKESFSETIIQKSINDLPVAHRPVEPLYPPVSNASDRDAEFSRIISPRLSVEDRRPDNQWTSPKPFEAPEYAKSPVLGDVNHENLRKQTIRETARAIESKIKEYESNEYELKAPSLVRHITPSTERYYSPRPLSDIALNLQPGSPPEMCFAARPPSSPKTADSTPTPTMQRVESRKFKPIKPMETSGYVADTEESLYSCTKTQKFESSSNKQYYETHDNKQITQSEPFSFYDSKTEKTCQTSGNVEKVRFILNIFCVFMFVKIHRFFYFFHFSFIFFKFYFYRKSSMCVNIIRTHFLL